MGDVLLLYSTEIRVGIAPGSLQLAVDIAHSEYRTVAPVEPAAGSDEEDEIVATRFRRQREAVATTEEKKQGWKFAVGGSIAVLGVVAWVLFTSQSVRFETDPAMPDQIALSGGWLRLPLGDRYLVRPGNYTVRLDTEGYYPATRRFEVTSSEAVTVRLEQVPLPGTVIVLSDSETPALVEFDDEEVGVTPLNISGVTPGRYRLRVSADAYLPWEDSIEVVGRALEQTVAVQLVPAYARVHVESTPPGASVLSGEAIVGETPGVARVPEGRQTISVVLDGYKPADIPIAVLADTDVELEPVTLEKADGELTVTTRPSGANVTVDGRYRGQSPVRIALAPNTEYVIGLSKAGYGRTSRKVRVGAAEGQTLDVDLSARNGEIELTVMPDDATVYVNGRALAGGSRKLTLPASPHRIEVRRDGFETWRRTLTPRPGFPQRVAVRLRTADEARVAGITQTLTSSQGQVLRYVDPGEFRMGASRRERGRRANETLRNVRLTRAYYLGTREITNQEFQQFKPNHDSGADVAVVLNGNKNPVANVTWREAAEFCNWLSKKDGLTPVYEEKFGRLVARRPTPDGYRLPTEAEWAWAARYQGGKGYLKFPWGGDLPPKEDSGNYADQSAAELVPTVLPGYDDGFAATAPVAKFSANAAGLHDMGGNVAEWMHDYYEVFTPDSSRVWTDPEGPELAKHNVIRGSGWRHASETALRFSFRDFGSDPRPDVGFRIARNAPAAE